MAEERSPRCWERRVGEVDLLIPKKRSGPACFPSFLEPRRRSEQAIVAVVMEAYVNGLSTRKVERLGPEPLVSLFSEVASPLAGPGTAGALYRDLRLVSIDPTCIEVPDTEANDQRFGLSCVRLSGRAVMAVLGEDLNHGKTSIDPGGYEEADRVERSGWRGVDCRAGFSREGLRAVDRAMEGRLSLCRENRSCGRQVWAVHP